MVTLKACIIMKDIRKDGTWRVVIRLTYKRKSRMIPTTMYVSREDITASGNIRNQQVIDECERLIRTYQKRIRELNLQKVYPTQFNRINPIRYRESHQIWTLQVPSALQQGAHWVEVEAEDRWGFRATGCRSFCFPRN